MKLKDMMGHFFYLYGERNRVFLLGLSERVDFLGLGIGDLQEAIRKEYGPEIVGVALARVIARIFCITEHFFWSLPLIEMLSQKYPENFCSYCQNFPCKCQEKRASATLEPASKKQLNWSLKQWQNHLNVLYGERNKKKGIENILNRLFKETTELSSLQMMIPNTDATLDEIEKQFALELADGLAWILAIANFFGIDLEKAVLNRYGKVCWKCHRKPCICTRFNVQQVNWDEYKQ